MKQILTGVLLGALFSFLLMSQCRKEIKPCDTKTFIDTTWVTAIDSGKLSNKPTGSFTITDEELESLLPMVTIESSKIPCEPEIVKEYIREIIPSNVYIDTIRKDSSYVVITDSIFGWRLGSNYEFVLKYPIIESREVVTLKQNKFRLYALFRYGYAKQQPINAVAPGIGFITKKGIIINYDYNIINNSHNITFGKTLW